MTVDSHVDMANDVMYKSPSAYVEQDMDGISVVTGDGSSGPIGVTRDWKVLIEKENLESVMGRMAMEVVESCMESLQL